LFEAEAPVFVPMNSYIYLETKSIKCMLYLLVSLWNIL